jgi:hypothetical protein
MPSLLLEVADFSVKQISSDVFLVTYRSISSTAKAQMSNETLRSSIWRLNGGSMADVFPPRDANSARLTGLARQQTRRRSDNSGH